MTRPRKPKPDSGGGPTNGGTVGGSAARRLGASDGAYRGAAASRVKNDANKKNKPKKK